MGVIEGIFFLSEKKKIPPNFLLQDGTKKIILNADAFKETDNKELQVFLQYVKTGKVTTAYTGRYRKDDTNSKMSERMRKEYSILPAVIMDAINEGEARGKAEGSRQTKLETAKTMLTMGYPLWIFVKFPGLLQTKCSRLVICNAIMDEQQGNYKKRIYDN